MSFALINDAIESRLESFTPPRHSSGTTVSTRNIGYGLPVSQTSELSCAIAYEMTRPPSGVIGVLQLIGFGGKTVFRF